MCAIFHHHSWFTPFSPRVNVLWTGAVEIFGEGWTLQPSPSPLSRTLALSSTLLLAVAPRLILILTRTRWRLVALRGRRTTARTEPAPRARTGRLGRRPHPLPPHRHRHTRQHLRADAVRRIPAPSLSVLPSLSPPPPPHTCTRTQPCLVHPATRGQRGLAHHRHHAPHGHPTPTPTIIP